MFRSDAIISASFVETRQTDRQNDRPVSGHDNNGMDEDAVYFMMFVHARLAKRKKQISCISTTTATDRKHREETRGLYSQLCTMSFL